MLVVGFLVQFALSVLSNWQTGFIFIFVTKHINLYGWRQKPSFSHLVYEKLLYLCHNLNMSFSFLSWLYRNTGQKPSCTDGICVCILIFAASVRYIYLCCYTLWAFHLSKWEKFCCPFSIYTWDTNLPVVMQEYFGRTESTEAIVYNRRFLFTRHHIDKTKGDGHKLYQENFFFIVRTSIHWNNLPRVPITGSFWNATGQGARSSQISSGPWPMNVCFRCFFKVPSNLSILWFNGESFNFGCKPMLSLLDWPPCIGKQLQTPLIAWNKTKPAKKQPYFM